MVSPFPQNVQCSVQVKTLEPNESRPELHAPSPTVFFPYARNVCVLNTLPALIKAI